jgi:hypothetical protein
MVASLSQSVKNRSIGFSVFDQLSYSDNSLPFGDNDYIDTWRRPQRAKWMSQELYDSLPERMDIRVVAFNTTTDNQTEPLTVVTTLVDHETYQNHGIGSLYGYRWYADPAESNRGSSNVVSRNIH